MRQGINASEWFAQSKDYSPERLRSYTTLDDIARMRAMGFDQVRLSIDPAIFQCDGPWSQCDRVQVLDEVVAKALSQNLAVIIDIHPGSELQAPVVEQRRLGEKFTCSGVVSPPTTRSKIRRCFSSRC